MDQDVIKKIKGLPNKVVPKKELCFEIAQRENWIPIGKYGNYLKRFYPLELGTDGEFRYSYPDATKATPLEV